MRFNAQFRFFSVIVFLIVLVAGCSAFFPILWHSAAAPHNSGCQCAMIALFAVMLAIIALVLIICNVFAARIINPIRQSMEDAEAANRAKSVFIASMSHEIRTPMNSIMGFSELALDSEIPPKTRDYLGKIKANADWLLQIINDILDISKIESGKMVFEKIPFDMHELFTVCRALIMPIAIEKGIRLHFYAEPSVGKTLLGDPTRLRQVLVNLLSNAVKFTNTGMVKLHAAIAAKEEKSITMHFEIKDSGIGMSSEQIDRIFDPFTQAETETLRKYGGTGLGLPITKNIIELMGGKLNVLSTLGVGSKFSFDLAFESVDVPEDTTLERNIVFTELAKPMFEGEILLCEDNVMNQQVICEHLARVGIAVVVAENGKAGLEIVKSRKDKGGKQFDLIFMDMHMPVMDGLEASSKIFELDTGVPIVAMTANVMSNDREIYRMSGLVDCVSKPFTSQELWRCLLKYFTPVKWVNTSEKRVVEADVPPDIDLEFIKTIEMLFMKSNRNKYEEIVKALDEGDIKLAYRLSHNLKSNAGQIGKTRLQSAAATIEHSLVNEINVVTDEQLRILRTELTVVLNELSPLADELPQNDKAVEQLDAKAAQELFGKLEAMLKCGNPDCLHFTGFLRAIPESRQLIQQIEDYEFESAFRTLTELKNRLS